MMTREANDVTEGMLAIAAAIDGLASAVRRLGTADAGTPMGALEAHGALLKEDLAPMLAGALDEASTEVGAALLEAAEILAKGQADASRTALARRNSR